MAILGSGQTENIQATLSHKSHEWKAEAEPVAAQLPVGCRPVRNATLRSVPHPRRQLLTPLDVLAATPRMQQNKQKVAWLTSA